MARNGSGTYTVPNSFAPGDVISSALQDQNFSDIGSELTNSLAKDGQTTMTGPVKAASGTVTAPGYTFGSDLNTGFYRIGSDEIGVSLGGTLVGDWATTGLTITGTFSVSGHATLEGVTSTGATGTGKFVFGAAPTLSHPVTITGVVLGSDNSASSDANIVFYDNGGNNWGGLGADPSGNIVNASQGDWYWSPSGGANVAHLTHAGALFLAGALTQNSDRKLKKEIKDYAGGSWFDKLRPRSWLWKHRKRGKGKQYGFIAQEVREFAPHLVFDDGGTLHVNYVGLIVELVAQVQALKKGAR